MKQIAPSYSSIDVRTSLPIQLTIAALHSGMKCFDKPRLRSGVRQNTGETAAETQHTHCNMKKKTLVIVFFLLALTYSTCWNMQSSKLVDDKIDRQSSVSSNLVDSVAKKPELLELVEDYDETGHFTHRLKHPLPVSVLKVNTPIFIMTLPKGGTTTLHQYFQCGLGIGASAHHRYPYAKQKKLERVGRVMEKNIEQGVPLLDSKGIRKYRNGTAIPDVLDQYQVFSDFDFHSYKKKRMFSMLDALDNIARFYPTATILYVERDPMAWVKSAKGWGSLLHRWRRFKASPVVHGLFRPTGRENFPLLNKKSTQADHDQWVQFYRNYGQYIRDFVKDHPSLTLFEVPLDSQTDSVLEDRIGIPSICWGHANLSNDTEKKDKKGRNGRGPLAMPRDWTVATYSDSFRHTR